MGPRTQKFLKQLEDFMAQYQISPPDLGRAVIRDPNFIHDLRAENRSPTFRTAEKFDAYMAEVETARKRPAVATPTVTAKKAAAAKRGKRPGAVAWWVSP
jgi:hypothetical protein